MRLQKVLIIIRKPLSYIPPTPINLSASDLRFKALIDASVNFTPCPQKKCGYVNLRTATQSHFWVAIWVAFYLKYDEMVRNGMVELKASNGLIFDSVGVSYPFNFFNTT